MNPWTSLDGLREKFLESPIQSMKQFVILFYEHPFFSHVFYNLCTISFNRLLLKRGSVSNFLKNPSSCWIVQKYWLVWLKHLEEVHRSTASAAGKFFLRLLKDGVHLPWEPENYSRSSYIIIQSVLSPEIEVRITVRVRIKVKIRVRVRVRVRVRITVRIRARITVKIRVRMSIGVRINSNPNSNPNRYFIPNPNPYPILNLWWENMLNYIIMRMKIVLRLSR